MQMAKMIHMERKKAPNADGKDNGPNADCKYNVGNADIDPNAEWKK